MTQTKGTFVRFRLFCWWQLRCRSIVSRHWGRVLLLPAVLDGDGDEWRKERVKNGGDRVRNV
ncbi:hypothetical protein WN943_008175 [Citrus x changshan-huyou]